MKYDPTKFAADVIPLPSESVIDDVTFKSAEIDKLFGAIGAKSMVGQVALLRDLIYGVGEVHEIRARQEAIQELTEGGEFSERATEAVETFAENEEGLYTLIEGRYAPVDNVGVYRRAQKASRAISSLQEFANSDSASAPESQILVDIVRAVGGYATSKTAAMLEDKLYFTPLGIRPQRKSRFLPRLRFRPSIITGRLAIPNTALYFGAIEGLPDDQRQKLAPFVIMPMVFSMYSTLAKPVYNDIGAYRKIRKTYKQTEDGNQGLRTIARIDELLALSRFDQAVRSNGYETTFPALAEEPTYSFSAQDLRNPLLAYRGSHEVVPNDIELGATDDSRLTFLTGPNSGGKSTISKALVLNQLLGHVGGPVVARSAQLTVADKIAYHVPTPPELDEQTGRFGFELKQVKSILNRASENSLSILDDCLDGTTHEERVVILKGLLLAFRNLTGATLFSTHAHELVEEFERAGVGQFLQVEFDDAKPTHKIVPGVSHDSHARSVAAQYGLDEEALRRRVDTVVAKPIWF